MIIENAKIESTILGYEDHGILTCYLMLDYGGTQQGFGGYGLDGPPPEDKKGHRSGERTPHIVAGFWIQKILNIVGVEKWEDLKGKYIRVAKEDDNWNAAISGIGNILQDKWFYPKKDLQPYIGKEEK